MRRRLFKIANKISNDVISAVILPDDNAFRKYLEDHPDYREGTEFIVNGTKRQAPKKNNNNKKDIKTRIEDFLGNLSEEEKSTLNQSDERMLHFLSFDKDDKIRESVAKNQHCSPKTLKKLSNDKSENVRAAVANHHACPEDILERYAKTEDNNRIREAVARNPKTSSDAIKSMLEKNNFDNLVYSQIAAHPNTPTEYLEKFTNPDIYDDELRTSVASNPSITPEIVNKLSKDRRPQVLFALQKNEACPPKLSEQLYNKLNFYINHKKKYEYKDI